MDVIRDYSALSFGVSAESLTQLVSVSSHFTCNLLTAITCTYSLSGMVLIYRRHSSLDLQCTILVHSTVAFVRRRCHRVASSGRRIAPSWPRRMACLQRLAGTDPVSLQSWSVQQAQGQPGRRLQSPPSEWPDSRPIWQCRALCAGAPWVSQATWLWILTNDVFWWSP